MKRVSLQDILLEIEKQTGLFFSYESSMLKEFRHVSLTARDESLSYCLKRLFEPLPLVYRITGHDEQELDSSFRTAMEKANLTVEDLNLMDQDKVPEDADAIMILAPLSDFSTDDAQKVKDYMAAGGKAIVVTTYTDQDMTNFKSILDEYGVSVTKGILAETDNGHYYQNPFYLIPEVKSNTYTSDFADSKYVFAPYAQGLTVSENDALSVTQMLVTSENAVVKDDPQNMTSYESEDGDETGQFTLGAKVEKTADDTTSTLFVFSSENLSLIHI